MLDAIVGWIGKVCVKTEGGGVVERSFETLFVFQKIFCISVIRGRSPRYGCQS